MESAATQPERRRIDQIREPAFVEDLDSLSLDELRARRDTADIVETELSYYRRLLHGRMDLLAFEQRRRRGEETRSVIDALPEILTGRDRTGSGRARHLSTDLPDLPVKGKRHLDRILGNDLMIRLSEMTVEELVEAATELTEMEEEISAVRQEVQAVLDRLQSEVIARYKNDLGDPALRSS
ncbi:MAG: aerial mycelium formation protein [Acidimicrobiia bacterium]